MVLSFEMTRDKRQFYKAVQIPRCNIDANTIVSHFSDITLRGVT